MKISYFYNYFVYLNGKYYLGVSPTCYGLYHMSQISLRRSVPPFVRYAAECVKGSIIGS